MTNAKKPIPDFKNRQEMAEWFDAHDMTEYDFKPSRVRFAKNLSVGLNIRLDPDSYARLRTVASKKGIGPTTLARAWINEHLSATR
ncbi:MAG TPA: CopG family antitoxin [Candidatus Dormibacteraeota bacterium]|nr:CopG family antitoxin [Candidatus Dormibacteraeota bacterium]